MTLKFDIQPSPNVTSDKDRAAKLVDPGFGRVFTDHMAIVRYSQYCSGPSALNCGVLMGSGVLALV